MAACPAHPAACQLPSTSPRKPKPAVPSRAFARATSSVSTPSPARSKSWSMRMNGTRASPTTSTSPCTTRAWVASSSPCSASLPSRPTAVRASFDLPEQYLMSNEAKQQLVEATLRLAPVVPVVIIEDASRAVGMARALVAGGIPSIEVTLRTPAALDAVRAIAAEVEGAFVGVGTVLTARDLEAAFKAGAKFAVSPGSSPHLLDAAADHELPLLPGAATSSEAMN